MESQSNFSEIEQQVIKWQKGQRRAKITAGILIIAFGTLFLLHRLKFDIPHYLFSWPMILIAVGFVSIVRHKFKKLFGYVLMLLGGLFLFQSWYPNSINKDIIFPVMIILVGLMVLFKRKNSPCGRGRGRDRFSREHWRRIHDAERFGEVASDDYLDTVNFFSGLKKNVTSQNFKGADIVTVFGGTEVNLSNADFEEKVVIDISCVFAGTTLNIPNNWQINSDVTSVFGGIEDKRPLELVEKAENKKIVVLHGSCIFGGIEITSFSS